MVMKRISDKRVFVLVCLNAAIYVLIVFLDTMSAARGVTEAQGLLCDCMKYAAIVSCLCVCLFALKSEKQKSERRKTARIQAIVFCFTLVADALLLFTPYFAAGVIAFLGAHTCALIRYRRDWLLRAGVCAAALFFLALLLMPKLLRADWPLTLVVAVCAAYSVLIISVTVSTFHAEQPRQNTVFSRVGMLLFLACDINVALFNGLPAGAPLHTASIVLMWFFYLPAQTLLALSATTLPLLRPKE